MSKWNYFCLSLLSCTSFVVKADTSRAEEFRSYINQSVTNEQLKNVALEAGDSWTKLLAIYQNEIQNISEVDAQLFTAEAIGIEMCLSHLQLHLVNEPDIKAAYFPSIEESVLYVQAVNNMATLVGEDDSLIQQTITEIICGNQLTEEEIKNITKTSS